MEHARFALRNKIHQKYAAIFDVINYILTKKAAENLTDSRLQVKYSSILKKLPSDLRFSFNNFPFDTVRRYYERNDIKVKHIVQCDEIILVFKLAPIHCIAYNGVLPSYLTYKCIIEIRRDIIQEIVDNIRHQFRISNHVIFSKKEYELEFDELIMIDIIMDKLMDEGIFFIIQFLEEDKFLLTLQPKIAS